MGYGAPLPDDLIDPICSVHDDELQIDEIMITFIDKGEGAAILLLGKRRRLSLWGKL